MSRFLLKSVLSDVSDFGDGQPVYWIRSSAEKLKESLAEPQVLESLQSGIMPDCFQHDEEWADAISAPFLNRFKVVPERITLDGSTGEGSVAADILACINGGFKVLDLSKIAAKDFRSLPPMVGIYPLQGHRQMVKSMACLQRLENQDTHVVSSTVRLSSASPEELIGDGIQDRVLSIILPYLRGNADLFIDKDFTLLIPIVAGKHGRFISGLPQWFDADRLGCKVSVVEVDSEFTEHQAAVFTAKEANSRFRLPKPVQVQLVAELWADELRPNTGRRNGVNMGEKVGRALNLPKHTADRLVQAARTRLQLNQYKSPHAVEVQAHPEANELAGEIKSALDKVAAKIAEKDEVERPLLLCDVLRASSSYLRAKYLQDRVDENRGAA